MFHGNFKGQTFITVYFTLSTCGICAPLLYSHACYVISNSYTMGCPPVRGDNPRALASVLSYVQVVKYGITILYHLHQCRPSTSSDISC